MNKDPIGFMHGRFTYIWVTSMVNVGKHSSPVDPVGNVYLKGLTVRKDLAQNQGAKATSKTSVYSGLS